MNQFKMKKKNSTEFQKKKKKILRNKRCFAKYTITGFQMCSTVINVMVTWNRINRYFPFRQVHISNIVQDWPEVDLVSLSVHYARSQHWMIAKANHVDVWNMLTGRYVWACKTVMGRVFSLMLNDSTCAVFWFASVYKTLLIW